MLDWCISLEIIDSDDFIFWYLITVVFHFLVWFGFIFGSQNGISILYTTDDIVTFIFIHFLQEFELFFFAFLVTTSSLHWICWSLFFSFIFKRQFVRVKSPVFIRCLSNWYWFESDVLVNICILYVIFSVKLNKITFSERNFWLLFASYLNHICFFIVSILISILTIWIENLPKFLWIRCEWP